MCVMVFNQINLPHEPFITNITYMRLPTNVRMFVISKFTLQIKIFIAYATYIVPMFIVYSSMNGETAFCSKSFVTYLTYKGLIAGVRVRMLSQLVSSNEPFMAYVTHIWPLISMSYFMIDHITLSSETFIADITDV